MKGHRPCTPAKLALSRTIKSGKPREAPAVLAYERCNKSCGRTTDTNGSLKGGRKVLFSKILFVHLFSMKYEASCETFCPMGTGKSAVICDDASGMMEHLGIGKELSK